MLDEKVQEVLNETMSVQMELSNLCNMAVFHKKCFAHYSLIRKEKIIMPRSIVFDILETLERYDWGGSDKEIKFHEYNEPLIDPRLFQFVVEARKCLPTTNIMIWTNGFYLNTTLLCELVEAGVNRIRLTAYEKSDILRFNGMKNRLSYALEHGEIVSSMPVYFQISPREQLDDRLSILDRKEQENKIPCYALKSISLRANGRVSLCCMDYDTTNFMSTYKGNFEYMLSEGAGYRLARKRDLENGIRWYNICKRCDTPRPCNDTVVETWKQYLIYKHENGKNSSS